MAPIMHHPLHPLHFLASVSSPDHARHRPVFTYLTTHSVSISLIYLVAARTNWLSDDPMLWFAMLLMPTGPPALKLTALADVNGSGEAEKLSIAKFLTVSIAPRTNDERVC